MNYFRSHLAVAFRSIRKSPMMTSLMVLSLSIAVAVSAILLSFIQSEAGVNRDLARSDQQYVLKSEWKDPSLGIPFTSVSPLPMALAEQYPHLVANGHRLLYGITSTIGVEEHFFMESIQISDPKLFEIYEIPLVFGDPESLLEDPDAAVISTKLAKKLFGSTQVMGELIRIKVFQGDSDPAGYRSFRITGVWDEIPYNSVIDFGATNYQVVLGPGALESFANPVIADSWEFIYAGCFVELAPGITPGDLAQPLATLLGEHAPERIHENLTVSLQPITDFYLEGDREELLSILGMLVGVVLLLGSVNFINLAVGKLGNRSVEIGIRKLHGGSRKNILVGGLSESLLYSALAFLFGIGLAMLLISPAGEVLGKDMTMEELIQPGRMLALLAISVVLGFLSIAGPAFLLSGIQPISIVSGALKSGKGGMTIRRILVWVQFSATAALIIVAWSLSHHVQTFFKSDLGFTPDNAFVVESVPRNWSQEGVEAMIRKRDQLLQSPVIDDIYLGFEIPDGRSGNRMTFLAEGEDPSRTQTVELSSQDERFQTFWEMDLAAGVWFRPGLEPDDYIVINESMASEWGWSAEDAIGKRIYQQGDTSRLTVTGVLKDFHFKGFREEITPMAFVQMSTINIFRYLVLKTSAQGPEQLAGLQEAWQTVFPEAAFEGKWMDDILEISYGQELRLAGATIWGGITALVLVILGIIGQVWQLFLASRKSLGIRKMLGAPVLSLFYQLLRPTIILYGTGMLTGGILAWWWLSDWKEEFVYQPDTFAFPYFAVPAFILLLVIVSLLSNYRGLSLLNPAEVVRNSD